MSATTMVVSQTRYNLIATLRAGTSIALGIIMPVVFYIGASFLFGSEALGGDNPVEVRGAGEVPDLRTFYVGGFMAYAIIYTAFVALLPDMVDYRERGLLKRLRGTPLPLWAFITARTVIVLAVSIVSIGLLALLAVTVFDIPTRAAAWGGITFFVVLGCLTFVSLAFAATSFVRNQSGAQGLSNAIGIALAMISGVFFAPSLLPDPVQTVAQFFPLQPLANGFQSLYVTGATGLTIDLRDIGILAAWALVGVIVIALRGFRWQPVQQR
jgi:ABC-2 type transport system permease protein